MFARDYAHARDAVCCTGMLVDAILCAAHATLVQRREWALNEKRLIQRAGLLDAQGLLSRAGGSSTELIRTVDSVADALAIDALEAR
jgi:hypothetical protein